MKKVCTRSVKLYVSGDWRIEVVCLADGEREVWLYRKGCGVKHLMFGVYCKGKELLDLIEANLPEHIRIYKDLYDS